MLELTTSTNMDEAEAEIIKLYELKYSDLVLLSSAGDANNSSSSDFYSSITRSIMETLGPTGPGLLAITEVRDASKLRNKLLPLARRLALLDNEHRKRILKDHNLGSDIPLKNPDRSVSSFAMQLKYGQDLVPTRRKPCQSCQSAERQDSLEEDIHVDDNEEFNDLQSAFKELGCTMIELGMRVARICDKALGIQELEQSLLESRTAKGRLIHYHSYLDGLMLKQVERIKQNIKKQGDEKRDTVCLLKNGHTSRGANLNTVGDHVPSHHIHSNLWQQWHFDYGVFTVLTDPMFFTSTQGTETKDPFLLYSNEECLSPSGHTYLQIYEANRNSILKVKVPSDSFVVQVGESADIISKGMLRSTLHSVSRPAGLKNLSRENFVVFLQPAWNKVFNVSEYLESNLAGSDQVFSISESGTDFRQQEKYKLSQEIKKIVPPLLSRLKDGMTFAEFSRETTKQYYGGGGLQSNK